MLDYKFERRAAACPLTVAVFCKWGKHRSVGLATEVVELAKEKGYTARVIQLERPMWDRSWRNRFASQSGRIEGLAYPLNRDVVEKFDWYVPPKSKHRCSLTKVR